jgi:hypothetical protein
LLRGVVPTMCPHNEHENCYDIVVALVVLVVWKVDKHLVQYVKQLVPQWKAIFIKQTVHKLLQLGAHIQSVHRSVYILQNLVKLLAASVRL